MFNSEIISWETWFACGNSSEPADLCADFKTTSGNDITKIKFDYVYVSDALRSSCYQVKMSIITPSGWVQLQSDYANGYLYNGWYKLRIEKNGDAAMNYSLSRSGGGVTDFVTGQGLGSSFNDLARVEWYSTRNPVVSPIVFWDEHTVSLVSIS
jgi:hypothetical protein